MGMMILMLVVVLVYSCSRARATDHGFDHSTVIGAWMEGLKIPDGSNGSCCGKGDAYEADIYDIDGYQNGRKECVAEITDGSAKEWPDGSRRYPIPNGLKFSFPCMKVNPPSDGNPTGHAIAFISATRKNDGTGNFLFDKINNVYCFVPLPPGS
jgi:hypothetical protein